MPNGVVEGEDISCPNAGVPAESNGDFVVSITGPNSECIAVAVDEDPNAEDTVWLAFEVIEKPAGLGCDVPKAPDDALRISCELPVAPR
jgi:hypothetical protein